MHTLMDERVTELLGDGQWHNYEATVRELGKLIPPGIAVRKVEKERLGEGTKQRGGTPAPAKRKHALPIEKQVENGRRSLVRVFLKHKRFQTDQPGHTGHRIPDRKIRMVRK
jgi:hypothetical protein